MQWTDLLRLFAFGHSVQARRRFAARLQLTEALPGAHLELLDIAELDRRRRTRLGAGGGHVIFQPVVAERALVSRPYLEGALLGHSVDHAEGAGGHAEAAAVADVLLDIDGVEFGAHQRAGRTSLQAGRVGAVLADVRHHQPAL